MYIIVIFISMFDYNIITTDPSEFKSLGECLIYKNTIDENQKLVCIKKEIDDR